MSLRDCSSYCLSVFFKGLDFVLLKAFVLCFVLVIVFPFMFAITSVLFIVYLVRALFSTFGNLISLLCICLETFIGISHNTWFIESWWQQPKDFQYNYFYRFCDLKLFFDLCRSVYYASTVIHLFNKISNWQAALIDGILINVNIDWS